LEPRSRTWKHPARLSMRNILYKPTCWSVLRESWSCFTPIPPQPSSSHTQSLVFIKSKSLLWTWHSRTMQRQLGFHGIASLGPDQPPNHALAEVTGTSSQKSTTQQVSASGGAGPSSSHQQQPQSSGSQSPPPQSASICSSSTHSQSARFGSQPTYDTNYPQSYPYGYHEDQYGIIDHGLFNIDNRLRSLDARAERMQGLQDTARWQQEIDDQLYTLTTTMQEGFQVVNSLFGSWNPYQQPPSY
jgi:hypothetical protein